VIDPNFIRYVIASKRRQLGYCDDKQRIESEIAEWERMLAEGGEPASVIQFSQRWLSKSLDNERHSAA